MNTIKNENDRLKTKPVLITRRICVLKRTMPILTHYYKMQRSRKNMRSYM
jgi:hypothetical protein